MKRLVLALLLIALTARPGGASIPPPPPGPPADLPAAYGGYATRSLWNAYIYWVIDETDTRRDAAYERLEVQHTPDLQDDWRVEREGPRYHLSSYWLPAGTRFSLERICPWDGDGAAQACLWRYRSAFYQARDSDVYRIVFETFDGARFAEQLSRQGVTPQALDAGLRTDFGLAQAVHAHLDSLIVTRDVREDACPGVREAVEAAALVSVPLSPNAAPDGARRGPPPLPGSDDEELVFPVGAFAHTDVEVRFAGRGSAAIQDLVSRLVSPVSGCFERGEDAP